MTSVEVVFRDRYGLHPRAAMRIQQAAKGFRARVTIQGLESGSAPIDARSMVALVSAGIRLGETVRLTAEGDDEAEAVVALRGLIERGVCHP
ncbi:MAG: HPr family phosphocarrier protein [Chloroflexota bacterium]